MISPQTKPLTRDETEAAVRAFLADALLPEERLRALGSDDDLFKVLDSLQVLRLVLQLDELSGLKVAETALSPENPGSLSHIAAFAALPKEIIYARPNGSAPLPRVRPALQLPAHECDVHECGGPAAGIGAPLA